MKPDSTPLELGERYVVWLESSRRSRWAILLLPFLVAIVCAASGAFSFSSHTSDNSLNTPSSTLTRIHAAFTQLDAQFPNALHRDVEGVLIHRTDGSSVLGADAQAVCALLNSSLSGLHTASALTSVDSYYTFAGSDLSSLSSRYLSTDGTSLFLATNLDSSDPQMFGFVGEASGEVDRVQSMAAAKDFTLTFTGPTAALLESAATTGKGFALANGAGLPFIALLFFWKIRSVKLLMLPGIALGLSLTISYGLGLLFAATTSYSIPNYVPDIMLFLCIALAIDYSFFLASRFQQERLNGASVCRATQITTSKSGGVIAVSGTILAIAWLALLFFPVFGLQAVGVCSALAVISCMFVNLCLTPAILVQFPDWYSTTVLASSDVSATAPLLADEDPSPNPPKKSIARCCTCPSWCSARRESPSCYRSLAIKLTSFPLNIVVPLVVFTCFALGAAELRYLKTPVGLEVAYGDGVVAQAYRSSASAFPAIDLYAPFTVVINPVSASAAASCGAVGTCGVFTDTYLSSVCALAKDLASVRGVDASSIESMALLSDGSCVNSSYARALANTPPSSETPSSALFQYNLARFTDLSTNHSSILSFSSSFDPNSEASEALTHDVRDVLDRSSGVSASLFSSISVEVDSRDLAMHRLPWVLTGCLVLVFGLIALRFRAAFVPVKLALSIALPIAFVYGLAVLVYQKGIFNSLGWHALSSNGADGISWFLPISTVFLAVGLAVDYELFLFARVAEWRASDRGYSTREAIVEGVGETASVISTAGIIMALAFLGMVVNTNSFLNQFGFVMILGVLVDTFISRLTLLSVLSLGGDCLNWWPGSRSLPPPKETTKW